MGILRKNGERWGNSESFQFPTLELTTPIPELIPPLFPSSSLSLFSESKFLLSEPDPPTLGYIIFNKTFWVLKG